MNPTNLEIIKLKYRLSQLEQKIHFYAKKSFFLDLLDLEVNRKQVKTHLKYLNYKVQDGKKIYLAFSEVSIDGEAKDNEGVKLSRFYWEKLEKQQLKGRNVDVVVNGHKGGYSQEEIKKFVGIFCDINSISVDGVKQRWQEVGFVEPSFSVDNGSGLIQCYWLFNQPLKDKNKWYQLQDNLYKLMNVEPGLINAAQSLNLAGCWRIEPNKKPILTEICQESGQKYEVNELEKLFY